MGRVREAEPLQRWMERNRSGVERPVTLISSGRPPSIPQHRKFTKIDRASNLEGARRSSLSLIPGGRRLSICGGSFSNCRIKCFRNDEIESRMEVVSG